MRATCLVFLALSLLALGSPRDTRSARRAPVGPTVELDYGTFNGRENQDSGIISFLGVRFADAPTGNLRWKAPVTPPSTHLGTVDATKFGNSCIQATSSRVPSGASEDCLFGNVYIPSGTSQDDKLPILVWFHGGGFQSGSTHDISPALLMNSSATPMIFVSFEYRLGALGFLGGSQIHADGALNAGLLDQRAALQWLQRYIGQFGGDKSKVTIWGQSAGAGSTMFHLIANRGDNQGLFRAAMGDSPSLNFMPTFDEDYDEGIFTQYAGLAGCGDKGADTLKCLRAAPIATLASASSRLLAARSSTLFVFAPFVDKSFISERPVEAFKAGHFAKVPVLFGSNSDEGAGWSASLRNPSANTSMPNATEDTVFNFINGQYATATRASINKGFELYPLDSFNGSFSLQGQQMYGEARYICTAAMITGSASQAISGVAYQYHYDNPHLGSTHSSELQAIFGPSADASEDDLDLFQAMREYYTSFVATGTPSSTSGPTWEKVSSADGSSRIFLHPAGVKMEELGDLSNRCDFWHGLSNELQT
ncbi:hypothetical protein NP233_g877 [Leucocoprinus birnbaumii]|uniref:Carboxylic ester hydrolase n=1 Tax=Leucocoprinus birnbaumii TaxID=56174 RepID=A0AAD5Z013_9AGAR|nr:hypothetical protein NP233_g877 [Leucocoprinus birnbaumii]